MEFEIPQDVTALSDEELGNAISAANEAANGFAEIADEDFTDEQIEAFAAVVAFRESALAEQASRAAAVEERAARLATLRTTTAASEEPSAEADPEEEENDEEESPSEEPTNTEETVVAAAPRVISAPARRTVARRAAEVAPEPEVEARPTAVITASANVPGYDTGSTLTDLTAAGAALVARMRQLPTQRVGGEKGQQQRFSGVTITKGRTDNLTQDALGETGLDSQALVAAAIQESRLEGGSLVAAGGWCAPSETLYDLCTLESTDGLVDLPEIQVSRGGIRYTKGPDFSDIYNEADGQFWLTEAEVIAAEEPKPCLEIACPDFTEVRLDAVGLCIRVPLLTQAAYPELVRRWIEGALVAHQHKVSAGVIQRIINGSTALNAAGNFHSSIDSLGELEQVAEFKRQEWRAPFNTTLEILLPKWYRHIVRGDLARRNGVDLTNVTDAQIDAHFANRGLRPQWLYNLHPLTESGGVISTPDTISVPMYLAGTWVKGTTDVISLDAVYDSTSLSQNMYTALFVEEGILVANTCFTSSVVTINAGAGATGETAPGSIDDALFVSAGS